MRRGEQLLVALALVLAATVLGGVTSCAYRAHVTLPLEMADKGYCWQSIDVVNYAPRWAYMPCGKEKE